MDPDDSGLDDPTALRRLDQRREAVAALDRWISGERRLLVAAPHPRGGAAGPGHFHPVGEVFLQIEGRSRFDLGGSDVRLPAGALLLMPAGRPHLELPVAGSLNLVVKFLAGRCQYHLGRDARDLLPDAVPCDLDAFTNRALAEAAACADPAAAVLLAGAWAVTTRSLLAGPTPSEALADPVRRVLLHVREHLADPACGPRQVAAALGLSTDHLSRLCRRHTGRSLQGLIEDQRLAVAESLLIDPALTASAVARACGFRDPDYFARRLRIRCGAAPRAWRRRHGTIPPGKVAAAPASPSGYAASAPWAGRESR